jgi:hypothetical protein
MATYIVNNRNIFFSDIQKKDNDVYKDICPHCRQINKYPIKWGFTYENNKIVEKKVDLRIYIGCLCFLIIVLMMGMMLFSIFLPVNLVEKGCNNLFDNNGTNDVKECNNQIIKNNTDYRKYQSYSGIFNSISCIFNMIVLTFIYMDLCCYKVRPIFKNWENVYNKYINKYYYEYYNYTIEIYKEKHNYDVNCLNRFKKYVKLSVIFTIILISNNIFTGVYISNYKIENITSIEQIVDIVGDNIYVLTINSNTICGLLLLIMFMVIIIILIISTRNEIINNNNNKIMIENNDSMPNIKIISIDLDENIKDKQHIINN